MKKIATLLAGLVGAAALSACGKHSQPNFIYMPDMYWGPVMKYQSPGMKPPVAGTVPRDYHPMPASMTLEEAGKTMPNPLKASAAVLHRGQQMFNTYCIVCHGPYGEGNGTIVPKFPQPPTLQSDKLRKYADGSIYYVMTRGQNLMPSYASQIAQADRWAIVHYVRAIQRAKQPSAEDVKAYETE